MGCNESDSTAFVDGFSQLLEDWNSRSLKNFWEIKDNLNLGGW